MDWAKLSRGTLVVAGLVFLGILTAFWIGSRASSGLQPNPGALTSVSGSISQLGIQPKRQDAKAAAGVTEADDGSLTRETSQGEPLAATPAQMPSNDPPIPVATASGTVFMTQAEFEQKMRAINHLPVLSAQYVFGRSIPLPPTDKNGHVVVLTLDQLARERSQTSSPEPNTAEPPAAVASRGDDAPQPPPDKTHQGPVGSIPIATAAGIVWMSEPDYRKLVQNQGRLPVLSKAFVFGRTIALPKTDKEGRIHVSNIRQARPGLGRVEEPRPNPKPQSRPDP